LRKPGGKPAMPTEPQEDWPTDDQAGCRLEEGRSLDELFERLYQRIHRLAVRVRWNGANPTLNPTALVHEAYMKLRKSPPDLAAKSYDEVIAIFANAMHQILADAARRKGAQKRMAVSLPDRPDLPIEDAMTVVTALDELQRENPRQAHIVRCRLLLGMTADETAAVAHLSKRTVEREWQSARECLAGKIHPAKE
jgi:RNA polymerase sigma factor (TIGR02999 family)